LYLRLAKGLIIIENKCKFLSIGQTKQINFLLSAYCDFYVETGTGRLIKGKKIIIEKPGTGRPGMDTGKIPI